MSDKQDIRLSPAAMKIHESWCRNNGYQLQASSDKLQATSGKLAPRYNSSDFEPRRGEKK